MSTTRHIGDEKYVSFTSMKRNGEERSLPVWIVQLSANEVAFTSAGDAWKVKRVRANAQVSLQPCDVRGRVRLGKHQSARHCTGCHTAGKSARPCCCRKSSQQEIRHRFPLCQPLVISQGHVSTSRSKRCGHHCAAESLAQDISTRRILTLSQSTQSPLPSSEAFTHRPALDGLRTVAVYLVVLFHSGLSWMRGGFIGVDLFFLLSGFLVTNVMLAEYRSTGSIQLRRFYARRVRRLLPAALIAIVIICLLASVTEHRLVAMSFVDDARSSLLYFAN